MDRSTSAIEIISKSGKGGGKKMIKLKDKLHVKGLDISIYSSGFENEFISLTDIAKYKNEDDPRYVIQNWMRNKNTIELLGVWEQLHNPNFNRVQFEAVKKEAGSNRFVLTPLKWIWHKNNQDKIGNIRDYASIQQLLVLANMESYNAILIKKGLRQSERIIQLRELAIQQLNSLLSISNFPKLIKKQ